jgi:hypothetical protein
MTGVQAGRLTVPCVTLLAGSERTTLRVALPRWSLGGTTFPGTLAVGLVRLVLDNRPGRVAVTGGATALEWTGPWTLLESPNNIEWGLTLRGSYQEPCSCQGTAFQSCSRRKQGHQGHQPVIWFSLGRLGGF